MTMTLIAGFAEIHDTRHIVFYTLTLAKLASDIL